MATIVFESLFPVLLVIVIGLGLRKSGIVSQAHWEGIELLGYWLLIPALVMVSLIQMDLASIELSSIVKGYVLAVIIQMSIVWLLRKPLNRYLQINDRSFSSIFQTATRWNGFIALAIANNLAGDQGLAIVSLIIALTVPILNVTNVVMMTVCCSASSPTFANTLINTLKVPLIWAALAGLVINLWQLPIYEPLIISFDIIGRAGLGVGLLAIGAGLHVRHALNARAPVLIGVIAKLFVFPLLVFLACRMFGVDGLALQIAVLSASVSTASNGYILARQMGGDFDSYAATASLQIVVCMFSIPLILWLLSVVT